MKTKKITGIAVGNGEFKFPVRCGGGCGRSFGTITLHQEEIEEKSPLLLCVLVCHTCSHKETP